MMLGLLKVYVFLTAVDMRKSIDALALLVQGSGFSKGRCIGAIVRVCVLLERPH